MATVLLAWELGGGYGHAARVVRLEKELRAAGQRVVMAVREPSRVAGMCGEGEFTLLESPLAPSHDYVANPRTFAHLLWNAGFGNAAELEARTDRWAELLDSVKADLVVFDHAPTALLAARGRDVRRVVIGTGFSCPPDCEPLPDLRPWYPPMPEQLAREERHVLECMNRVLARRGGPPLQRVSELYADVDDTFLTTLEEFDHYPDRAALTRQALTQDALTPGPSPGGRGEIRYRGPWPLLGGVAPVWPAGGGKRIFAYLSPFQGLPRILQALRATGCPAIIFGRIDRQIQDRYSAANIRFETRRLDLHQVAAECDLALLNGGQASTITFHLAGKPVIHAPIFLEQGINATNTARLGAGAIAFPRGADCTDQQLADLLGNPAYTRAAQRFAARYANFSADAEVAEAVRRLAELCVCT